jgi:hypothetical protein
VEGNNGIPLLVGCLVEDGIPGESGIVDNDVDLAVAEFGSLLDELWDVGVVEEITWNGNGRATGGVDFLCYILGLGYPSR